MLFILNMKIFKVVNNWMKYLNLKELKESNVFSFKLITNIQKHLI